MRVFDEFYLTSRINVYYMGNKRFYLTSYVYNNFN